MDKREWTASVNPLENVDSDREFLQQCLKNQLDKIKERDQLMAEKGVKHDHKKNRLDLLSATWISGVGEVLTFGAEKYAAHNWRKGLERGRLLGAALRHIFAYLGGEDLDRETGLLHLHHASCCLMFASELHVTRPDLDDRYKGEPAQEVKDETRNSIPPKASDPVPKDALKHCVLPYSTGSN